MNGPQTPPSPGPRSIMRRATYRRASKDTSPQEATPARRLSEPATLSVRRASAPMGIPIPPRPALQHFRQHTSRSVAFSEDSTSHIEMGPLSALSAMSPRTPTYPLLASPAGVRSTIFGVPTRFRPLWLLGAGNAGLTLFSIGEVLIQRAIWPVSEYEGLKPNGPTVVPGGDPGHGNAFGGPTGGIIAGSIFMAAGVTMAVGASTMFMLDGRRLNRAQNATSPNYTRTHAYYAAHLAGIAILVIHKFLIEAYRGGLPPKAAWATALPGGIGQAAFAVTQAQSFSSSEVANGKMPLRHRSAFAAAARSMVAAYIFLGAYAATPNASAYGREAIRMVTAVSTNLAYAMPLTSARLAGPSADIPVGGPRYRGDWSAMQTFCVYALARLAGTISSFWLSRSRWPAPSLSSAAKNPTQQAFQGAMSQAFRNLPPPLPSLMPDWDETAAACILMVISFGANVYAFNQFHRDATPPLSIARAQLACAILSVMLGLLFRAMQEKSSGHVDFELRWIATVPGFMAQALSFYAIPEMMARSESTRHNAVIPYRYQAIEACRFVGGLGWYLWASQCGIIGFPPVARQITIWAATTATLLGFALPNADTLRAARGATPRFEIGNPFER